MVGGVAFVVALLAALLAVNYWGYALRRQAVQSWLGKADHEIQCITDTSLGWLSLFQTQLRGVAALFYGSERVSEPEFLNALEMIEGVEVEAVIPLTTVAYVESPAAISRDGVSGESGRGSYKICLSSDMTGPLAVGADLPPCASIRAAMDSAALHPEKVVIGPVFKDERGEVRAALAITASNGGGSGFLLSVINLSEFMDDLNTLFIPPGMNMRVVERRAGIGNAQGGIILDPDVSPPDTVATIHIPIESGQTRWDYYWDILPDYQGGPATMSGTVVQLGGSMLVLAVFAIIANLSRQNARVNRLVVVRTTELRESEERFRIMFEENPDACFLIDLEGRFLDGNKAVEHQTGYRIEELVGQRVYESRILPPKAREIAAKRIAKLNQSQMLEPGKYSLLRKDNTEFKVEVTAMPIRLRGKTVILCCSRDLTARERAEERLAQSEERFRELFENMSNGVAVYEARDDGEDFVFKDINSAGQRMVDVSREEVVGRSVLELFPRIREMGLFEVFKHVWRTGEPALLPATIYQDGRIQKWVENHVFKLPSSEIVAVYENLTVQKQAEQDLQESEEKYRKVFESESDAIMIFDAETRRFVDVNNAAVKLYGYSREEFLLLTQSAITAEPEKSEESIRETLAGRLYGVPCRLHRKKDGTVFPVEIAACTFSWKGRTVVCGVIRDITERMARVKELQKNREELRKLASELSLAEQHERERVAAELHDGVSQLLTSSVIRLNSLKATSLPDSAAESIETICSILKETMQQTRSLTFELSCPMLNELGLAAALEELCASMTHEQSIRFEFKGGMEPIPLAMDRKIVLYRSTRELLINVMKHSEAKWACVKLEREDDHVRICVEDAGKGFDASMAGKGFSPTGGFGLFNIREYLQHIGGCLKIESIPGDGTEVVLSVPLEEVDE